MTFLYIKKAPTGKDKDRNTNFHVLLFGTKKDREKDRTFGDMSSRVWKKDKYKDRLKFPYLRRIKPWNKAKTVHKMNSGQGQKLKEKGKAASIEKIDDMGNGTNSNSLLPEKSEGIRLEPSEKRGR